MIVASILEALGLMETFNDELGGLMYKGPEIYQDFCHNLHLKYAEEFEELKFVNLKLEPVEVKPEYLYELQAPQFEKKEIPEESTEITEEEKHRSLLNKDRKCTCGFSKQLKQKVTISREGHKSHVRQKVMVGGMRRRRCKKCTGCMTPPCGACNFCLNPPLKKPCELRVCQFPVAPKCPCFL